MAWSWRYENSANEQIGVSENFDHRGDAETWIGVSFEDLLEDGVDQVRLFEDDTEIFGPMSLRPD